MPARIEGKGGPGRGQGRKPLVEGEVTVVVSIKMTASQKAKLAALGGAAWVREMIDSVKKQTERRG